MHACTRDAKTCSSQPGISPPLIGLALALGLVFFKPSLLGTGDEESTSRELFLGQFELHDNVVASTGRSLRGCCGEAADIRWTSAASGSVRAGERESVVIKAVDKQGRPASVASCERLIVNVSLSGHARLVQPVSTLHWKDGALTVEVIDDVAEEVDIMLRVSGHGSSSDVLLSSTRLRVVSGPPETFSMMVVPRGSPRSEINVVDARGTTGWPAETVLDVILDARDKFANAVSIDSTITKDLNLRSSSSTLKVVSLLHVGANGEARAQVRGMRGGTAELWLESDGIGRNGERTLRDQTVQRLWFDEAKWRSFSVDINVSSKAGGSAADEADAKWRPVARDVRKEFLHAWKGYKRHAWGADELAPLSHRGKDTFGNIGITILDSLTTLLLMDLSEEFEEAAAWVSTSLNFDKANREVSVFELIIRALGGLLGAHSLSGRQIFLDRAKDLGDRILGAFNTSSGMPLPRWDIAKRRGHSGSEPTILAEAGSFQLEFRALTALTGDVRFREAADRSLLAIRSSGGVGLIPVHLTPPLVTPTRAFKDELSVGALADSYYEYLLKQWLQSPSEGTMKNAYLDFMDDFPRLMPDMPLEKRKREPLRVLERSSSHSLIWKMEHLSCFAPGMIALGLQSLPAEDLVIHTRNSSWRWMAEGLAEGCAELWTGTASGLAPEHSYVDPKPPHSLVPSGEARHSYLRPETAESLFYLYRLTGDEHYRRLGEKLFRAIVKHSKVPGGFATVVNVDEVPTNKADEMQSFVLAETFKYLYLLFAPRQALDLDRFVLNTEAHPLRKLGPWVHT